MPGIATEIPPLAVLRPRQALSGCARSRQHQDSGGEAKHEKLRSEGSELKIRHLYPLVIIAAPSLRDIIPHEDAAATMPGKNLVGRGKRRLGRKTSSARLFLRRRCLAGV